MATSSRAGSDEAVPTTRPRVRPRRDFAAMEARRMQAVDLFEDGDVSKAEIGRRLGVSHQTVSDWHQVWRHGGRDALRAAGRSSIAVERRAVG